MDPNRPTFKNTAQSTSPFFESTWSLWWENTNWTDAWTRSRHLGIFCEPPRLARCRLHQEIVNAPHWLMIILISVKIIPTARKKKHQKRMLSFQTRITWQSFGMLTKTRIAIASKGQPLLTWFKTLNNLDLKSRCQQKRTTTKNTYMCIYIYICIIMCVYIYMHMYTE